jgi:hypothetical protein
LPQSNLISLARIEEVTHERRHAANKFVDELVSINITERIMGSIFVYELGQLKYVICFGLLKCISETNKSMFPPEMTSLAPRIVIGENT